ncbi:HNH endonuclease [Listeria booriae]|uniref:HNH endonuclease n=1 Tax=Listeria booriae TaxID=1552123 RepID=UPI0016286B4B|nr:hypothetical protein [Listeria booriae]MBC1211773.1 HNH endonuclease [Listeria booriae]
MARRSAYSKVIKDPDSRIRADHVKGKGDVLYKLFQCINPECTHFICKEDTFFVDDYSLRCEKCGQLYIPEGESKFYEYDLLVNQVIREHGEFIVLHKDYIAEAPNYKYCIVCNILKPIDYFDQHSARKTGRQGECRSCKKIYNGIKNGTRLVDQHREAAQKRRLYISLSGDRKIDSALVYKRYNYRCFNCNKDLTNDTKHLDHTLPVYYLYPLTSDNATLLCDTCNSSKNNKWPSTFYNSSKLKELAILTGFEYDLLAGKPCYNKIAIEEILVSENIDSLLTKYAKYFEKEIIPLRNRIMDNTGIDIFINSRIINEDLIKKANTQRAK